jgi:hypothetical protein
MPPIAFVLAFEEAENPSATPVGVSARSALQCRGCERMRPESTPASTAAYGGQGVLVLGSILKFSSARAV